MGKFKLRWLEKNLTEIFKLNNMDESKYNLCWVKEATPPKKRGEWTEVGEKDNRKVMRKLWGVMGIFTILAEVIVSQIYTYVKSFKSCILNTCQLLLYVSYTSIKLLRRQFNNIKEKLYILNIIPKPIITVFHRF